MRLKTSCTRDCPDACGMVATVEDGRVVRLQGDREHPVTQGFLCYRTDQFLERQYHPERLQTPLVRRDGEFAPVSWDEALDLIAEHMLRIRAESGPAAILHYRSGGSLGILKQLCDYFFERFGPTAMKTGDICSGAGEAAQMADFGDVDSHDLADLDNSRTILVWGKNPHVSNVHSLPILKRAKARGVKLIFIDPIHHRGAQLADLYVRPRPGGDIALGFGVARCLFENGWVDAEAERYCDHLDAFRAQAMSRSLAQWASLAGVASEDVAAIARHYSAGPAAILVGWGMQRKAQGATTVRVLDALGAISGNLGIPGGGVSFSFKRRGGFDLSFCRGESAAPRLLYEPRLGPEILAARAPEVRMVWVTAGNPVAMLPESETVKRALESRELTVVVDQFLTDTAMAADVVLPVATMLEDDDVVGAFGNHYLGEVRPVVAAPEGAKTDYEILQALAPRVGLAEEFSQPIEVWKRRVLGKVAERGGSLEELRAGAVRNPLAPAVTFEDRVFATASGKVNLVHDVEIHEPPRDEAYPLTLLALSTPKAQSSQWAAPVHGPAEATVHPDAVPGMGDGDLAEVASAIASMVVRLRLDPAQRRDTLLMAKGGWLRSGRCANALVPARLTDGGGGGVYYDTGVCVRPVAADDERLAQFASTTLG
ncbi:molybdopterin-dependent oxidoreductase [Haliangium ochraceum]|uniref:Nitrate reductase n=1 Tax=Haliangium ochraceum (strain DSM 14365 / JCM 11303 / SMP-2) TaxID=502025 RepID=D0LXR5_HALO1|nr:molybdopterin-dependent oxidoreductase [Haliangium ochraceum]ACY17820.1 Nitrate reductase [Haliangium ochraceum DSM 14365]